MKESEFIGRVQNYKSPMHNISPPIFGASDAFKIGDRVVMNETGVGYFRHMLRRRGLKRQYTLETKATVIGFCRAPDSFRLRIDGWSSTTTEAFAMRFWHRLETTYASSETA